MFQSIAITNNVNYFGNDWGLYVDIENSYSPNKNYEIIRKNYNMSTIREEDCEYEYYEEEYNRKMEMEYNKEEMECNKQEMEYSKQEMEYSKQEMKKNHSSTNFASLIFRISSTTLATAAFSYCLLCLV